MPNKGTILIADNAPEVVGFMVEVLTEEGYAVLSATSGDEALAAMLADPPDLALLDLVIGEMSGVDVLQALQAHEGIAVPIVI